ncbi:hypothetical protein IG631_23476 [Alternaria alternata]|nr:hypothetical protein IG631_23476 [Alternaria alternata]
MPVLTSVNQIFSDTYKYRRKRHITLANLITASPVLTIPLRPNKQQTPQVISYFTMRYSTPVIALAVSLVHLATAQLGSDDTICGFLYGTDYTDACCHTVISRGVNAPCTDIEYVSNLTDCSSNHFPTGWAVCVEKDYSDSGPVFGHGPSGIVMPEMTMDQLIQVYRDYFSSNAMGESLARAVAQRQT